MDLTPLCSLEVAGNRSGAHGGLVQTAPRLLQQPFYFFVPLSDRQIPFESRKSFLRNVPLIEASLVMLLYLTKQPILEEAQATKQCLFALLMDASRTTPAISVAVEKPDGSFVFQSRLLQG
jgi:hypothetical protein